MSSRIIIALESLTETEELKSKLDACGNEAVAAHSIQHLLELSTTKGCDVAFIDMNAGGGDGLDAARTLRNITPDAAIILVGEPNQINSPFGEFISLGFDFVQQPLSCEQALIVLERAKEIIRLKNENRLLESQWEDDEGLDDFISRSPRMIEALRQAATAAETLDPVLIYGPPGSEKEIVAFYIHRCSYRAEHLFVRYRCGRLGEASEIVELFGCGGVQTADGGRARLAAGGTLLLDNVCELRPASQARLLRFIEDGCAINVSAQARNNSVRIICTTAGDLHARMRKNIFRPDLFYRLNTLPITIPPLNERPEDIVPLAQCFIQRFACEAGKDVRGMHEKAAALLQAYDWPGNVEELKYLVRSAIAAAQHSKLMPEDLLRGPARGLSTAQNARRKSQTGGGK